MSTPDVCVYQCPLCQSWQMDYSVKMMLDQFGRYAVNDDGQTVPDMRLFYDTINGTFRDHLGESHPLALHQFNLTGGLT